MQGKSVNGFVLKRLLGTGGMAEVWYAENEIGKPAAVKILSQNLSGSPQIVERFHNEALVMVKLNHPNIRQVYDYGYIDNRHCIIMEYLEGNDLETLLKKGFRFNDEVLCRWWNQIAHALNYTHAKGIVHRDIKPSNIFIDSEGNAKLTDFGIAKIRESISFTMSGAMIGTLLYMSPEQVQDSKNLDYRSDVYSLAVTFIHLVSGKAPYDSTTSNDYAIRKGIVEESLDLSLLPAHWRNFLLPYLEKDPQKRPALWIFPPSIVDPAETTGRETNPISSATPRNDIDNAVNAPSTTIRQTAVASSIRLSPSLSHVIGIVAALMAGLVMLQAVIWLLRFDSSFQIGDGWRYFIDITVNMTGLIIDALLLVWFALAFNGSKRKAFGVLALIALSACLLVNLTDLGVLFSRHRFFYGLRQDQYYNMTFILREIGRVLLSIAFILMGSQLPNRAKSWSITIGVVLLVFFVYCILYKYFMKNSFYDYDLFIRKVKILGSLDNTISIVRYAFMSVFFFLCFELGKKTLSTREAETM